MFSSLTVSFSVISDDAEEKSKESQESQDSQKPRGPCEQCIEIWEKKPEFVIVADQMHCAWCGQTDRKYVKHWQFDISSSHRAHCDFCNLACLTSYNNFVKTCWREWEMGHYSTYSTTNMDGRAFPFCFTGRNPNLPLDIPLTCDYCGKTCKRTVACNPLMPKKFEYKTFCTDNKNKCIKAYMKYCMWNLKMPRKPYSVSVNKKDDHANLSGFASDFLNYRRELSAKVKEKIRRKYQQNQAGHSLPFSPPLTPPLPQHSLEHFKN
jgi:hypothetical protein